MRVALRAMLFCLLLALTFATPALFAQATSTVQGTVLDQSGAVVPNAAVKITNEATSLTRSMTTDVSGAYQFAALPTGVYTVEVSAPSMQRVVINGLKLDVSRTVAQNFTLKPGTVQETVSITSEAPVVESTTMTVGQVMDPRNVQEIPLNGRHFVDLGLLVPGSVTPPANGFLTAPIRGQGSLAFNTAGQREDTVNFMVNGINLADMANGQITFQPSLATLSEFKVDNSSYSAAEGRNSGAVVNMATRAGTNQLHGEVFEYLRNNYFDARNFFNKDTTRQAQFIRHDFGADVGGPIIKNKLFFYASYEGLRQRQGISLSTTVLTAAQRSQALASPSTAVQKLTALIPGANDASGSKFLGSASAPVLLDQWAGDISYNMSEKNHAHVYYALQRDIRTEPIDACGQPLPPGCATVPGFGDQRVARRQLMTFNESHVFNPNVVNEFSVGFNRIHITFDPTNKLDPSSFGINNGNTGLVGIPETIINSIGLDFGGQRDFPQGRADLTSVFSDTVNWLHGRHSLKFGWEGRQVNDNNFRHDQTRVTFNNVTDFINGNVAAFTNDGDLLNHIVQRAIGMFAMDSFKLKPNFTLELGLRYEWNMTPFEKQNHQSAFVPATAQLVQVGTSALPLLYNQNNRNFEPRLGFAWDIWKNGKTVLRAGYGLAADQPLPIALTSNPPFTTSFNFSASGAKPFTNLAALTTDAAASGVSLASGTVDHNFRNPYVQSYNLNMQQEITPSMALMVGYFGSKATHLRQNINLNQPAYTNLVTGAQALPFPNIAADSPIAPSLKLGSSLTETTSRANSNYNALWITMNRHFANGLQFSTSYTWSHSLDDSSRVGFPVAPENSLNVGGDYGPSDFDVRHRFVLSSTYDLPFKGNRLMAGWRLGSIVSVQSGNPLNIVAGAPIAGTGIPAGSSTVFTGVATNRPDLIGPVNIVNQIITSGSQAGNIQWIAPGSVCDPRFGACAAGTAFALPVALSASGVNIYHFGNLGRNALIGPNFRDVDFSLTKTTRITERVRNELRLEVFDLFNHPNFGNPNTGAVTSVGNTFGVISSTRVPTGDAGGSRQLQFALKLIF
jgi:Carboxypeptidase regulatory-like domain/TonB dependent receptor